MELLSIIMTLGLLLLLAVISHYISNNSANKKLKHFTLGGFSKIKIYNKPCSTKIISSVTPRPRRPIYFNQCNLFITADFIVIQGIKSLILNTIVTQFVIAKDNRLSKGIENFGRYNWLESIELNANKTEIKLVYRVDYFWKPTYSLIISSLTPEEFEALSVMKEWL